MKTKSDQITEVIRQFAIDETSKLNFQAFLNRYSCTPFQMAWWLFLYWWLFLTWWPSALRVYQLCKLIFNSSNYQVYHSFTVPNTRQPRTRELRFIAPNKDTKLPDEQNHYNLLFVFAVISVVHFFCFCITICSEHLQSSMIELCVMKVSRVVHCLFANQHRALCGRFDFWQDSFGISNLESLY